MERVAQALRALRRRAFRFLVRREVVWPAVVLCAREVRAVEPDRPSGGGPRWTILALNPDRFRGDLEALAATGRFRVLRLPFEWQGRVLQQFYPLDMPGRLYFHPEADPAAVRAQRDLRRFLARFVAALYRRLGVDCVLSAAVHYRHDLDWGVVSEQLGVPWVVLHRENLVTTAAHFRRFVEFSGSLGAFRGSHIIVHNEVVRDAFTRSGFAPADKISVLGAMRMDGFVRAVRSREKRPAARRSGRRRVVFFSFGPGAGLFGKGGMWPKDPTVGLVRLFADAHVAVGELARDRADVDFVIKPKWGGRWIDEIVRVMEEGGVPPRELGNVRITADADAQKLILEADVVIGFGSTVLLEAGIAAKPVVVPLFAEAAEPEYADYIHLRDDLGVFDVADGAESLKRLVLARLERPEVAAETVAARKRLFEHYVSSLRGDAAENYAAAIGAVLAARRGVAAAGGNERAAA